MCREEIVDGCHIIVITVPRAQRYDRPVYMDGDPFMGSYRRNGEGDYRCVREDVEAMLRDAQIHTWDMTLLKELELSALDVSSVARYRRRMGALSAKSCLGEGHGYGISLPGRGCRKER